jgi:hypothetical protein
MIEIEFFQENGQVHAFIGQENCSGIKVSATNVNDLIENMKDYLLEIAENELK